MILTWILCSTKIRSLNAFAFVNRQYHHAVASSCSTLMTKPTDTIMHQTQLFSASSFTEVSTPVTVTDYGNVILFDGVCNFCNTWVDILLRMDRNQNFKFAPLQSSVGKELLVAIGKEDDDISSVVLVKTSSKELEYYDKSGCVLQVVEDLGPLGGVFSMAVETIVPRPIRDSIYDTVAENRYNFLGKRDECRCGDPQYADQFLA
jgi:predicted DCC family thiol-disulfide oxidoreductase YuxK